MGGSSALSRVTLTRMLFVPLACLVCVLATAATAHATADIAISYTNAHGVANTERDDTGHYQGNDTVETGVTVNLFSGKFTSGSLKCDSESPNEDEQCDDYYVFSGSYEAFAPCEADGSEVVCPDAENFTATLGGGTNDEYVLDAPLQYEKAIVKAGKGGDLIEGTDPAGYEGEFPDVDEFTGGTGMDRLVGGPGNDIIRAKVDGLPDSGIPGQQDTIEGNVTEVDGSEYNDTLTAGTTPVTLDGEGGNDTIYGGPGGDTLRGGGGGDTIYTVGPDGPGPDSIYASEEFCNFEYSCPTGNTTIYANDGIQDQIACAPAADIVYADALDVVATTGVFGCLTVLRSAPTGSSPGVGAGNPSGGGAATGGVVAGTSSFAHFKAKGNVASLEVACAGASTSACTDTLTLSVVETLRSGKLVAVAAASKTKKKTVTIGHEW